MITTMTMITLTKHSFSVFLSVFTCMNLRFSPPSVFSVTSVTSVANALAVSRMKKLQIEVAKNFAIRYDMIS